MSWQYIAGRVQKDGQLLVTHLLKAGTPFVRRSICTEFWPIVQPQSRNGILQSFAMCLGLFHWHVTSQPNPWEWVPHQGPSNLQIPTFQPTIEKTAAREAASLCLSCLASKARPLFACHQAVSTRLKSIAGHVLKVRINCTCVRCAGQRQSGLPASWDAQLVPQPCRVALHVQNAGATAAGNKLWLSEITQPCGAPHGY